MVSLRDSIETKYMEEEEDNQEDFGFIVFVSCSPEVKHGMLPNIITLNNYNIEKFGDFNDLSNRIKHISELDLTDNLLSDWGDVAEILASFKNLVFLNLSNNLLNQPLDDNNNQIKEKLDNNPLHLKKLVLNGNNVDWSAVLALIGRMPELEEVHLSANNLTDPDSENILKHSNLRQIYLSCNPIQDFSSVSLNLISSCSRLELLSLAECPVSQLPASEALPKLPPGLHSLNISTTKIKDWAEVDKLRKFPALEDLRVSHCPFLDELSAHEKRMMLIARLPNVQVLNGGDKIGPVEREDAERAFIRHFLDTPEDERPSRFEELVAVHGLLDPLVNVDLTPEKAVRVSLYYKDECREETINVRQSVKQFKQMLQTFFGLAPANMRLWYYDQELSKLVGPEEMKWGTKEVYTYNVTNGDYFVVDEKSQQQLRILTGSPRSQGMVFGSPSPRATSCSISPAANGNGTRLRRKSSESSAHAPPSPVGLQPCHRKPSSGRTSPATHGCGGRKTSSVKTPSSVARNLFGSVKNPTAEHYGEFFHSKVFPDPKTD